MLNISVQHIAKCKGKLKIKLGAVVRNLGMKVSVSNTKVMKAGKVNDPVLVKGEAIETVVEFCYLDSVISTAGGGDKDIGVRIGKARYVFMVLQ